MHSHPASKASRQLFSRSQAPHPLRGRLTKAATSLPNRDPFFLWKEGPWVRAVFQPPRKEGLSRSLLGYLLSLVLCSAQFKGSWTSLRHGLGPSKFPVRMGIDHTDLAVRTQEVPLLFLGPSQPFPSVPTLLSPLKTSRTFFFRNQHFQWPPGHLCEDVVEAIQMLQIQDEIHSFFSKPTPSAHLLGLKVLVKGTIFHPVGRADSAGRGGLNLTCRFPPTFIPNLSITGVHCLPTKFQIPFVVL